MNTALTTRNDNTATVHQIGVGVDAVYVAPARFDVYEAPAFSRWVTDRKYMGATSLALDCSAVEFMDRAAVRAIEEADRSGSLRIVNSSTATDVTFELLAGRTEEKAAAA